MKKLGSILKIALSGKTMARAAKERLKRHIASKSLSGNLTDFNKKHFFKNKAAKELKAHNNIIQGMKARGFNPDGSVIPSNKGKIIAGSLVGLGALGAGYALKKKYDKEYYG